MSTENRNPEAQARPQSSPSSAPEPTTSPEPYDDPRALDPTPGSSYGKLIRLVPERARVLDVGCAHGGFCEALRRLRQCTVVGVEIDPVAAEAARPRCDQLFVGDIASLMTELPRDFDVVIAADVLEHLLDPGSVLEGLAGVLRPGGTLLASIPNVTHASVLLALAGGRFPRSREGLLDATHVRFFGRQDVLDLFHGAGYAASIADRVRIDPRLTEFKSDLSSLSDEVLSFFDLNPDADTYQFIVRAVPRAWAVAADDEPPSRASANRRPVASGLAQEVAQLHERLAGYHEALSAAKEEDGKLRAQISRYHESLVAQERQVSWLRGKLGESEQELARIEDALAILDLKRAAGPSRSFARLSAAERDALRVLFVTDRDDAPFRYRCVNGCEQLRHSGVIANIARADDPSLLDAVASYSIVVLFRLAWSDRVAEIIAAARRAGATLAFDIDDLIFDPGVEAQMLFLRHFPESTVELYRAQLSGLRKTLDAVDVCIGATPTIARHGRLLGKQSVVHPNLLSRTFLRLGRILAPARPALLRNPIFAYMSGSNTHDGDLQSISAPLRRVLSEQRDALLVVCGHATLPAALAPLADRVLALPYQDHRVYPWLMARCSALIAPIERINQFAHAKSALKVFEPAAFAVPAVASRTVQYMAAIQHGRSGFLAANDEEWAEALLRLCDRRTSLSAGAAAREIALQEYSPDAHKDVLARTLLPFCGRVSGEPPHLQPLGETGRNFHDRAVRLAKGVRLLIDPRRASIAAAHQGANEKGDLAPMPEQVALAAARLLVVARSKDGALRVGSEEIGFSVLDREHPVGRFAANAEVEPLQGPSRGCCFRAIGPDPSFVLQPIPAPAAPRFLALEMSASTDRAEALAQLFWRTAASRPFEEGKSLRFPLIADGKMRTYVFDLGQGPRTLPPSLHSLRFDPIDRPGGFEVASLSLLARIDVLDLPQPRVAIATRFFRGDGIEVEAPRVPDLATVPAGSQGFVICDRVLQSMRDPLGGLSESLRVLKPGGILYLAVPAIGDPLDRTGEVPSFRHLLAGSGERGDGHRHIFDRALFERVLRHACAGSGANVVELFEGADEPQYVAVLRKDEPSGHAVDVVVPVFNARELTRRCAESVLRYATGDFRLVLVDDASTEPGLREDLEQLAARDPRVVLLLNEQNLGFVKSANRGMRLAQGRDVLLLNSDTELFAGFLDRLREAAHVDDETGIVTPFSNNATIFSIPKFGDNPIPAGHTPESLAAMIAACSRRLRPGMPTAVGFCMYVRSEVLDCVGQFNEEAFGRGFGEENDLCERARAAGFKVRLCDDVFVWHKGKASFGEEGRELEHVNTKVLRKLHPGYEPAIARFFRTNPLAPLHQEIAFHIPRLRTGARRAPLFVLHSSPFTGSPGGTEHHVLDLVRSLRLPRAVVAFPQGARLVAAEVLDGDVEQPTLLSFTLARPPEQFCTEHEEIQAIVRRWVDLFGIGWAHLHHLMFWPVSLGRTLQHAGVPYVVSAHDYYAVCPSLNLFDYGTKARCECRTGGPGCLPAFFAEAGLEPRVDYAELRQLHRSAFLETLRRARAVVTPSAAARNVLLAHLPLDPARVEVIGHSYEGGTRGAKAAGGGALRLALIGEIAYALKGASQYLDLLARARDLPVEWHVFGNVDRFGYAEKLKQLGLGDRLHLHGRYERGSIVRLLCEHAIDLCVFLPAVDETFSFTLSEAFVAGVPALVTDRGALTERVEGEGAGIVVRSTAEAAGQIARLSRDRPALQQLAEKLRTYQHTTHADNARRYVDLYDRLGFSRTPEPELQPEWLHEISERAGIPAAPLLVEASAGRAPAAAAGSESPYQRSAWYPFFRRVKPFVPATLRKLGKQALQRFESPPAFVLRVGRRTTLQGLTLVRKGWRAAAFSARSDDPQMLFQIRPFDPATVKELRFRLRRDQDDFSQAQLFWTHDPAAGFSEENSAPIDLQGKAGEWREYRLRLDAPEIRKQWEAGSRIVQLRFDPTSAPGGFELGPLEFRAS